MYSYPTKSIVEHIFLDMDGVITDVLSSAMSMHNTEETLRNWPQGVCDAAEAAGVSQEQFYKPINAAGVSFWETLPMYPWSKELVAQLTAIAPVTVLTNPGNQSASCVTGKVLWLKRHFPNLPFLIGPQKYLCAKPGAVLIDDRPKNVAAFTAAGGRAILFSQPWNSKHPTKDKGGRVSKKVGALDTKPLPTGTPMPQQNSTGPTPP